MTRRGAPEGAERPRARAPNVDATAAYRATIAAFLAVALGALALSLPRVLSVIRLTEDSIGYTATAYNWTRGEGFRDPIVYSYYVPGLQPPAPAPVIRPPVLSLLAALPLALGSGLRGLMVSHAVWAALLGASAVWVGRRALSVPAAAAFGVALAWSGLWIAVTEHLLTEVTASGVVLLALALARGVDRSHRRALLLGAVVFVGWLTRPNLAVLLPALLCGVALERGPRAALACRPLWTLVLSFAVLQQGTSAVFASTYGFRPYAHYAMMFELLGLDDLGAYRGEPVGPLAFARAHAAEIAAIVGANLRSYGAFVFATPAGLYVGWVAAPALVHAVLRRGPGSLERRVAACGALLLTATGLAVWGGFDLRYTLPGLVCFWFLACALLDDAARALARRVPATAAGSAQKRAGLVLSPLLLVLGLWSLQSQELRVLPSHWQVYRAHGTRIGREVLQPVRTHAVQSLCAVLDRNAIVASPVPWDVYLWCGNAGLLLPRDLDSAAWVERYLAERSPGYVVTDRSAELALFGASARLRRVVSRGEFTLYEVRDAPAASRPWRAPPPLASLDTP